MAKMIEVHEGGLPELVNIDYVLHITKRWNDHAEIHFAFQCNDGIEPEYIATDETYDEIRKLIATAQGGIPVGRKAGDSQCG